MENAIKYSNPDTTISVDVSEDATVRVRDIGPGIPQEIRATAFDRFVRSDQRGSGLGLGLAIVLRVVQAHGGSIEVGDNPEGGAEFTMRFSGATAKDDSDAS